MSGDTDQNASEFRLNIALGLLSVVFVVLLAALVVRVIYPRTKSERVEAPTHLISNIIQIQVLNGCGISGAASSFTNKLRETGFDVVESGNFETFDVKRTFVIDRSGNIENARRVARALGIPESEIIREISPGFYLDATVVVGADFNSFNLN